MLKPIKIIQDAFGNNITLFGKNESDDKENILLVARFHGDEPEGEFCLNEMIKELSSSLKELLFVGNSILSLPDK